jgi:ABC-type uncharacterized transport system involved in gliding motility auxiliary subunit
MTTLNRRLLSMAALAVAAVLFIAINTLSQATLHQARLDLTADRLFTLSPGTRNILASLKEPIRLRLFFSDKLTTSIPQFRTYSQRVRETLEAYANLSHGMVRLEVIDPEPFSPAEDQAVEAGIQGIPLDQDAAQPVYFGLSGTNSTDHHEAIPYFSQDRETMLEYDISKLVYALTDPKKPVIGVIAGMDMDYGPGGVMGAMRGQSQPYAFAGQLRQQFDLRILRDVTHIDKDITALLVLRPQRLSDATLYAIDQYVLAGGRAMVYVDPWIESTAVVPGPNGTPLPKTEAATLPRLFQAWGLEMDDKHFVADPGLATRVTVGEGGHRHTTPYPAWLSITPETLNRNDAVTADLASLTFASAGALSQIKDASTSFTPLVWSSPRAQMLDAQMLEDPDPEALMAALAAAGTQDAHSRVLAVRLSGPVKTAFPDGPPPPPVKPADGPLAEAAKPASATPALPPGKPLAASAEPVHVIVVADTDLLEDRFWAQEQNFLGQHMLVPFAANVDFLINGLDNLTGSSDLISLRGRAGATRPFVMVDNLRRSAGEQFAAREQALRKQLEQTEHQISELKGKAKPGGSGVLLSKEEQAAIDGFQADVLRTRKELREVQHTLNHDIERLATLVKVINIGAMPVLVGCFALGLASWRQRRRRSRTVRD